MKATMLYGPRDVRCEEVPEPKILQARPTPSSGCRRRASAAPTFGLIAASTTSPAAWRWATNIAAIVEEVGSAVTTVRPGQFVVGSFCISDNTCPHCRRGFQSSCQQREFMTGAQAPLRARAACRRHAGRDAERFRRTI